MKKFIMEFIGTFFLMLSIILSTQNPDTAAFAPFIIGGFLIALVYMGGHISKAHYNPAVTLAFFMKDGIAHKDVRPYILAQILAAIIATFLGKFMLEQQGISTSFLVNQPNIIAFLISEFLGTFALVFVILNVAMAKTTVGNSFYGIAIGMTVWGAAYLFGSFSGGAFNPAVALGFCLGELSDWSNIWMYLLGSTLGSLAAVKVFGMMED